jgi:hypothetical protein
MSPTFEAHAADRTIGCVRRRSRSLAAGRPREALVQVEDAHGRLLALRGIIEAQILRSLG